MGAPRRFTLARMDEAGELVTFSDVRRRVADRVQAWKDEDVVVRVEPGGHDTVHVTIGNGHPQTHFTQWVSLRPDGLVELPAPDDGFTSVGRRLLPEAAAPELDVTRQLAATTERDAQADPPTAAGSVVLDRLVPVPGRPSGEAEVTVLEAAAGLLAVLDRARQADDLTLRDFRAAVAAAELTSRYAAVAAGMTGKDAGPLLVAGLAWQLAGHASMGFHDGRRGAPGDRGGVVASSQALVCALRNEVDAPAGIGEQRDHKTPADVAAAVQQAANQVPVLADRLTLAVEQWSRTGHCSRTPETCHPWRPCPRTASRQ